MNKRIYILSVFCIISLFLKGQENKYVTLSKEDAGKIFQKISHWYASTPSYSFVITHATYAGHKSTVPYEQKRGYFKKFNNGFHSSIADIQNIQNKNYLITMDSIKKIILVNSPLKNFEQKNSISLADYEKILEKCNSISILNGKTKTIKIEFKKNHPISSYEICLNKDELFQSITIFYANEVKSKTGQMVKPKLAIIFENYNVKVPIEKDELNENKFFLVGNNTVLKLKDNYADYTLLDQRIKNN